ncbi:MAG: hypothetical protein KGS61_14725 [Verrucomicrobia bacterium]|nr:hypothetical protein [Verrucomicrobiota bacterium]
MKVQTPPKLTVAVYFVGVIGTFLIMIALVAFMRYYTRPVPLEPPQRSAERLQNLRELNAASQDWLTHYRWANQARGIVVLPIDRAMQLVVQTWTNSAAGRSNLIQRVDKSKATISYE